MSQPEISEIRDEISELVSQLDVAVGDMKHDSENIVGEAHSVLKQAQEDLASARRIHSETLKAAAFQHVKVSEAEGRVRSLSSERRPTKFRTSPPGISRAIGGFSSRVNPRSLSEGPPCRQQANRDKALASGESASARLRAQALVNAAPGAQEKMKRFQGIRQRMNSESEINLGSPTTSDHIVQDAVHGSTPGVPSLASTLNSPDTTQVTQDAAGETVNLPQRYGGSAPSAPPGIPASFGASPVATAEPQPPSDHVLGPQEQQPSYDDPGNVGVFCCVCFAEVLESVDGCWKCQCEMDTGEMCGHVMCAECRSQSYEAGYVGDCCICGVHPK